MRMFMSAIEKANVDRFLSRRKLNELLYAAFSQKWPAAICHVKKITRALSAIIAQGNRAGEIAVADCGLAATLICTACTRFWHPRVMVEVAQEAQPSLDRVIEFCFTALVKAPSAPPLIFQISRLSDTGRNSAARLLTRRFTGSGQLESAEWPRNAPPRDGDTMKTSRRRRSFAPRRAEK